jgi:hypothetical protein
MSNWRQLIAIIICFLFMALGFLLRDVSAHETKIWKHTEKYGPCYGAPSCGFGTRLCRQADGGYVPYIISSHGEIDLRNDKKALQQLNVVMHKMDAIIYAETSDNACETLLKVLESLGEE